MTSERVNDGGPAFPMYHAEGGVVNINEPGMSLRDWFAGQALMGLIAYSGEAGDHALEAPDKLDVTDMAYEYADAMLKARESGATR